MAIDSSSLRETDEQSTRKRAHLLGVPYLDSRKLENFQTVDDFLTVADMRNRRLIPLARSKNQIDFAITINTSQQVLIAIRKEYPDFNVKAFMISDTGFNELMQLYDPPIVVEHDDIEIKSEGASSTLLDVSKSLNSVNSDEIVAYLIGQAVRLNASDIHMEALKDHVRMRFRIDGVLHPVAVIAPDKYRQIQSSIAIKAAISTTAPDAQTGHMGEQVEVDGKRQVINIRIETVPTTYGQDAVLRLFTMNQELLDLNKIGLSESQRSEINKIISHPHGLVLVVGPTGSGKTTTLYSILNRLNEPTRKIITLEDPVEYAFNGISQIQVNTRNNDSFDEKLRAVLRQDPDVIMLGEIRDADTAKTAMQASLTGHLVLSTFHADNSAAALTRLFDTIGSNPLLASAIKLVIAQRLVRRLDDATKVEYQPADSLKNQIKEILKDLPSNIPQPDYDNLKLYKKGESEQNPIGFNGRIVIMEQMLLTNSVQTIIHDDSKRTQERVEAAAKDNGMITMLQDAMLKVVDGQTTLEEVYKVIG